MIINSGRPSRKNVPHIKPKIIITTTWWFWQFANLYADAVYGAKNCRVEILDPQSARREWLIMRVRNADDPKPPRRQRWPAVTRLEMFILGLLSALALLHLCGAL